MVRAISCRPARGQFPHVLRGLDPKNAKGDAARPLSVYFLPVGLGRLINATLGKQMMPVNRKNATICQGLATVLGRKRAAPEGAAIVNDPDTYSWYELMSRDIDASKAFYTQVFGWEYDEMDMETMTYSVVKGGHEDEGRAGLMPMPAEIPEQVPSYWGVYFTVADADATVARAKELGGSVMFGPDDTPVGRLAAIVDPQGGNFSIMQPSEPSKG